MADGSYVLMGQDITPTTSPPHRPPMGAQHQQLDSFAAGRDSPVPISKGGACDNFTNNNNNENNVDGTNDNRNNNETIDGNNNLGGGNPGVDRGGATTGKDEDTPLLRRTDSANYSPIPHDLSDDDIPQWLRDAGTARRPIWSRISRFLSSVRCPVVPWSDRVGREQVHAWLLCGAITLGVVGERLTFKLTVDILLPFRVFALELIILVTTIVCGMVVLYRHVRQPHETALYEFLTCFSKSRILLMALLDLSQNALLFVSAAGVPAALTVTLAQSSIPFFLFINIIVNCVRTRCGQVTVAWLKRGPEYGIAHFLGALCILGGVVAGLVPPSRGGGGHSLVVGKSFSGDEGTIYDAGGIMHENAVPPINGSQPGPSHANPPPPPPPPPPHPHPSPAPPHHQLGQFPIQQEGWISTGVTAGDEGEAIAFNFSPMSPSGATFWCCVAYTCAQVFGALSSIYKLHTLRIYPHRVDPVVLSLLTTAAQALMLLPLSPFLFHLQNWSALSSAVPFPAPSAIGDPKEDRGILYNNSNYSHNGDSSNNFSGSSSSSGGGDQEKDWHVVLYSSKFHAWKDVTYLSANIKEAFACTFSGTNPTYHGNGGGLASVHHHHHPFYHDKRDQLLTESHVQGEDKFYNAMVYGNDFNFPLSCSSLFLLPLCGYIFFTVSLTFLLPRAAARVGAKSSFFSAFLGLLIAFFLLRLYDAMYRGTSLSLHFRPIALTEGWLEYLSFLLVFPGALVYRLWPVGHPPDEVVTKGLRPGAESNMEERDFV